jgi:hypothetical protein
MDKFSRQEPIWISILNHENSPKAIGWKTPIFEIKFTLEIFYMEEIDRLWKVIHRGVNQRGGYLRLILKLKPTPINHMFLLWGASNKTHFKKFLEYGR